MKHCPEQSTGFAGSFPISLRQLSEPVFPSLSPAPPPAPSPLTILGPGVDLWLRSDLRIRTSQGKVTYWGDSSGRNNDLAFRAAGPLQDLDSPSYSPSGGPNGTPAVVFDGIDDSLLNITLTFALPFYYWAVIEQVSWTDGRICWIALDFALVIGQIAQLGLGFGSPNLVQGNGTANLFNLNSNQAGTIGSFFRLEASFTNSVADYFKIHATNATGKNSGGNQDGQRGFRLAASQSSSAHANIAVVELVKFRGTPTPAQRAALDAYGSARYGVGVL